ncbi:ArsR/SmtB family transcription factor [Clostridium mediterraneense]|uniref:ArsR/SmtB family transcription factor n=1 Tax=Clostridium mediterraneense TaxID=1805472 RepID=UPI00083203EF|nr:metalloregulator ArsR/SmtB family transcription factor [Clostridium mediterraneense]
MENNKVFSKNPKYYEEKAEILKAIAHPIRLCIVRGLCSGNSCNVSYMQECLNIPQSTISQHLAKLKAAKIIIGERNGLEVNYRIANEEIKNLIDVLFN